MVAVGEIVARITWAADDPYLRFVGAMSAVALTIVGMVQIVEWMVGGNRRTPWAAARSQDLMARSGTLETTYGFQRSTKEPESVPPSQTNLFGRLQLALDHLTQAIHNLAR
jgi:hypothetical protein